MRKAKRNFVLLALLLIAISMLFGGCATLPPDGGSALAPPPVQAEEDQRPLPVFLMSDEETGITVEYQIISIARTSVEMDSLRRIFLVDPIGEYTLDPLTEVLYFKLDIHNPMGERLFFDQRVAFDDFKESYMLEGGNVENCVFMFQFPLTMIGDRNSMSIAVIYNGADSKARELETGKLVFLAPPIEKKQ